MFVLLILRAGVIQDLNISDLIISQSYNVKFPIDTIAASSNVPEKGYGDVIVSLVVPIFNGLPSICQDVGVVVTPSESRRFAGSNITGYFCDLEAGIYTFFPFIEEEELIIAPNFVLKSFLELFLGFSELLIILEEVEMGEHSHHMRKSVALEQREELEGFHFEAQTGIDCEEDYICDLGQVYHGSNIVGTFNYGYSLLLV